MKEVLSADIVIKSKDAAKLSALALYDSKKVTDKGAGKDKELKISKKSSPKTGKFWRLVHDGTKVIHLFESEGETITGREMFCGSLAECKDEIKRLKFDPVPVEDTDKDKEKKK